MTATLNKNEKIINIQKIKTKKKN